LASISDGHVFLWALAQAELISDHTERDKTRLQDIEGFKVKTKADGSEFKDTSVPDYLQILETEL
jgi:hypothetical protein